LWQRGIFYAPGTVDRVRIPPGHEDVWISAMLHAAN
jgi:hypothetical protein